MKPALLARLDPAMEADQFLGYVLATDPTEVDIRNHPLALQVITRAFSEMVSWPLTTIAPGVLRNMSGGVARRGPVSQEPVFEARERLHVVDHLKRVAELASSDREDELLLRRQACYLAGLDRSSATSEWLRRVGRDVRRTPPKGGWSLTWAAERSTASGLARHGDRSVLRDFIVSQIADDMTETANLNYWAYWVGEIDEPKVSDTFMVETSPESWYGTKLLQHLIERLSAEFGFVELNVHTLWALVRRKPGVLDGDPALLREVAARSESLRDEEVSPQARRELDAVLYAVAMKRGR